MLHHPCKCQSIETQSQRPHQFATAQTPRQRLLAHPVAHERSGSCTCWYTQHSADLPARSLCSRSTLGSNFAAGRRSAAVRVRVHVPDINVAHLAVRAHVYENAAPNNLAVRVLERLLAASERRCALILARSSAAGLLGRLAGGTSRCGSWFGGRTLVGGSRER